MIISIIVLLLLNCWLIYILNWSKIPNRFLWFFCSIHVTIFFSIFFKWSLISLILSSLATILLLLLLLLFLDVNDNPGDFDDIEDSDGNDKDKGDFDDIENGDGNDKGDFDDIENGDGNNSDNDLDDIENGGSNSEDKEDLNDVIDDDNSADDLNDIIEIDKLFIKWSQNKKNNSIKVKKPLRKDKTYIRYYHFEQMKKEYKKMKDY